MKYLAFWILLLLAFVSSQAQDNSLSYFISEAHKTSPSLRKNNNLQKIGEIQQNIIIAQNRALQVNATAEIQIAPYFNNNGRFIDITTTPAPRAYGYDVGITNGGLYSAQLNVTKNLFNQAAVNNLLFQNKVQNKTLSLTSEEIEHQLVKNITDTYILAYQLQLQGDFVKEILKDLQNRLKVVELLAKRAILMESDYLLLELDIETKQLEQQQIQNNFKTVIDQLYSLSGLPIAEINRLSMPDLTMKNNPANYFYNRKFTNDSLQVVANQNVFENQYKPQLGLYGNTGINAVEINNIDQRMGLSAGLRLTVPIYDGKQRKYNAEQNRLQLESLEYYKENTEILLQNDQKSILKQISALRGNMLLIEEQLRKQQNILEIYKGKLVQGQVSIVDYLNVIQTYKFNIQTKLQMQTNLWLLQNQYNFINW